jgi:hypothetical protein
MRRCIRVVLLFPLLALAPSASLAGPICTTTGPIAIPIGMAVTTAGEDADGDGLFDESEDELAACAIPIYRFDSDEPARQPFEPAMLHAVYPNGFEGGKLVVQVDFAELYKKDGGFIFCNFPQPNGCNDHVGDSQAQHLQLKVIGTQSAMILDPPSDPDTGPRSSSARTSWSSRAGESTTPTTPLWSAPTTTSSLAIAPAAAASATGTAPTGRGTRFIRPR